MDKFAYGMCPGNTRFEDGMLVWGPHERWEGPHTITVHTMEMAAAPNGVFPIQKEVLICKHCACVYWPYPQNGTDSEDKG